MFVAVNGFEIEGEVYTVSNAAADIVAEPQVPLTMHSYL